MATLLESPSELDLVREAQSGDSSAFGLLYDAYIKKIYSFIYYKTMHKDAAEDITSEVFMKAWKNLSQFQGGSFPAWLYTIARHAVIDYYRRRRELLDIEDCWDLADDSDLLKDADDGLKLDAIRQAMRGLKSREREIIMMRLWLDLPFKEIALHFGQQEGAVKMAFGRAIIHLRAKLPAAILILWPALAKIYTTNI